MELKAYINSEIRTGKFLDNTNISSQQFVNYIVSRYQKEINALKSEAGKARKQTQLQAATNELKGLRKSIKLVFDVIGKRV